MESNGTVWTEPNLIIVRDEAGVEAALAELNQNKRLLSFDFETTGLNHLKDTIHGVSICNNPNTAYYFTPATLDVAIEWLIPVVGDPLNYTLGHNLPFDWHFLNRYAGWEVPIAVPIDTMVMAWLVDENNSIGLKPLSERYLGETDLIEFQDLIKEAKLRLKKKKLAEVTIADLDQEKLEYYGAKDALLTYRLYAYLTSLLQEQDLLTEFFQYEVPFTRVLTRMEEKGLWVDVPALKELRREWELEYEQLYEKWNTLTGGINQNSNPQLQKYFYEDLKCPVTLHTKKGAPSTDALAILRLSKIENAAESATLLLELREIEKLLGTYVIPILEKAEANGGWLTGRFGQTGTVTGRLNSSDPNLQNIPARGTRGKKLRRVLGAPPGYVYVGVDYSQIELRLIAHYSQSVSMLLVFSNDGDPHQVTADAIQAERHIGKTVNFSWAYGAGPDKLCDTIEENGYPRPTREEAKAWLDAFGRANPELTELKQRVIAAGVRRGYIKTILGRRRHLPELTHYDRSTRGRAERQGPNSLIQGSVGDLMKYDMIMADDYLEETWGARLAIQVHDELGIICPVEHQAEVMAYVKELMESVEQVFKLTVPIIAEPKAGQFWADAK